MKNTPTENCVDEPEAECVSSQVGLDKKLDKVAISWHGISENANQFQIWKLSASCLTWQQRFRALDFVENADMMPANERSLAMPGDICHEW